MCVTIIARTGFSRNDYLLPACAQVDVLFVLMCNIKMIVNLMHSPASFLSEQIARVDEECINALMTLEYLSLLSQVVPAEKSTEIVLGQPHQGVRYHHADTTERASKCPDPAELFETRPIIDERIHPMYFSFDTLSILPKCQQAELLFSMFADG